MQLTLEGQQNSARDRRFTFWSLLLGYGGYYLCRANLGVAAPLLQTDLHLDKVKIGAISGVATLCYAAGKFTLGPTADILGGRRVFLLGMAFAILANFAFGATSAFAFLVVFWSMNRFVQAAGWMGLVQLVSQWYERSQYGVVVALLSLSFLLGDVVARGYSAAILGLGFGWRALFFIPATTLTVMLVAGVFTIRAPAAPVVGAATNAAGSENTTGDRLQTIFLVLAKSWGFWMTCVLSFLLTFLRTAFLDWTVLFLTDSGAIAWKAALQSALFPLTGASGTIFVGWYTDRVSGGRRGPIAAIMLGLLVVALGLLAVIGAHRPGVALICIGAAGFSLLGPYSLLGGCLALDYGGKRAAATAAGINDGVGYLGGSASGLALGGVVQRFGWTVAFFVLAACAAIAFAVALLFNFTVEKRTRDAT